MCGRESSGVPISVKVSDRPSSVADGDGMMIPQGASSSVSLLLSQFSTNVFFFFFNSVTVQRKVGT